MKKAVNIFLGILRLESGIRYEYWLLIDFTGMPVVRVIAVSVVPHLCAQKSKNSSKALKK